MLSIVIPTLNEEKNIPLIIKEIRKIKTKHEIIFVDDRSYDKTTIILQKFLNRNVKLIKRFTKPRDLSKSVLLGVNKAKYNHIMVVDCDLQHNILIVDKMFKSLKIKKFDLVIASRFKKKKY